MKIAVLFGAIALGVSAVSVPTALGQATPTKLTQPIVNAQTKAQEVNQAPVEDPRFTSRYGTSRPSGRPAAAPAPAPTVAAPVARPAVATPTAAPVTAPAAAVPAAEVDDPRFTSRYGSARPRTAAAPTAAAAVAPAAVTPAGSVGAPAVVAAPVRVRPADPERTQRIVNFQKQNAASGNVTAQYDLGMRYLRGDGVEQDDSQALDWLKLAAQNGHSRAQKELDALQARMSAAPAKDAAAAPAPAAAATK